LPRLLLSTAIAVVLGGCSLTMPFEDRSAAAQVDPDVTGSISPRPAKDLPLPPGQVSPFSPRLDAEDWRRQKAALATALDPQGNGGSVHWENTDSGAKGSFAPSGNATVIRDEICRTFMAMVSTKEPEQWFQGAACRLTPTEWVIRDMMPGKRAG
jgi:17 kDa outer membrane surface antigen